jgi:hypothetical protein
MDSGSRKTLLKSGRFCPAAAAAVNTAMIMANVGCEHFLPSSSSHTSNKVVNQVWENLFQK